jgi:BolA protein
MITTLDIENRLREKLNPSALRITDDSAQHIGHAGAASGKHFSIYITADVFAHKTAVARHRLVYDALSPLFSQGIHALAIHASAPEILKPQGYI